jgi:hypothetical protein
MRRIGRQRARSTALGAWGLARVVPAGRIDLRHLRGVVRRIGVFQIDSVNGVARAHLAAGRERGRLQVAPLLAAEPELLASWLGLEKMVMGDSGGPAPLPRRRFTGRYPTQD